MFSELKRRRILMDRHEAVIAGVGAFDCGNASSRVSSLLCAGGNQWQTILFACGLNEIRTRGEVLLGVLRQNEFDSLAQVAHATSPREWLSADLLGGSEIQILERVIALAKKAVKERCVTVCVFAAPCGRLCSAQRNAGVSVADDTCAAGAHPSHLGIVLCQSCRIRANPGGRVRAAVQSKGCGRCGGARASEGD